jgi:hypothetical protein
MSSKRRLNLRASHPTNSINIANLVQTLKKSIETESDSGRRVLKLYKVFKFINNEAHILKKGLFLNNNDGLDEIDGKTELKDDVKLLTLSSDNSTDGISIGVYNHPRIKYNGYESIEPTGRIVDGIGIRRVYREEQSHIEIPKYIDENKLQRELMVLNETNYYNYLLTNKEQTVIYYIKNIKPLYNKLQKILNIDVIKIIDVDPSSLSLSTSGGKNLNIKKVRKLKSYLK